MENSIVPQRPLHAAGEGKMQQRTEQSQGRGPGFSRPFFREDTDFFSLREQRCLTATRNAALEKKKVSFFQVEKNVNVCIACLKISNHLFVYWKPPYL